MVPIVVNNDAQPDNMFNEEVVEEGDQALAPENRQLAPHHRQASPKVAQRRLEE